MNSKEQLIRYRMKKARDCLKAAQLLLEEGDLDGTVNRAYYSVFHEVTALLLFRDISSRKHSGVMSYFNQLYIKTGFINKKFGKFYSNLYESRQVSDYGDFISFDLDIVEKWVKESADFLDEIDRIIEQDLEKL